MTYAALLRPLAGLLALGALALGAGCASHTVFQSGFNANPVGIAPAHVQATGTLAVSGAPGSIIVTGPPSGVAGAEHWVRISRTGAEAPITEMPCTFTAAEGDGTYTLLAAMFIPAGSGLATVEFDTAPSGSPANAQFLHLDFLQDGTVRMDDGSVIWGTYPHGQVFTLAVTLEIQPATTVAHLSLLGSGTSGSLDYDVPLKNFAHQIGGVKFWMGFPWQGHFEVTDILVTKRNS